LIESSHELGAKGIGSAQAGQAEARLRRPACMEELELLLKRGNQAAPRLGFKVGKGPL